MFRIAVSWRTSTYGLATCNKVACGSFDFPALDARLRRVTHKLRPQSDEGHRCFDCGGLGFLYNFGDLEIRVLVVVFPLWHIFDWRDMVLWLAGLLPVDGT